MRVLAGISCKRKCAENFRECTCGDKLQCQVVGDNLILESGGEEFEGEYRSKRVEAGWRVSEETRSTVAKRSAIKLMI